MHSVKKSNNHSWEIYLAVVTLIMAIGYFVLSPQKLFKPGDDIGYNIGLAGGIMMIVLLLYPLRKRVSFMSKLGVLPTWFRWHMIFGIMGPTLIVLHSTFHLNSINATVAMICMLLVSGSGSFGRFFYTKIHHGLYGREATVNEFKAQLENSGDMKSVFSFAPGIETALEDFRLRADAYANSRGFGLINFIVIGYQRSKLSRGLGKELHSVMNDKANENNFSSAQVANMEKLYREYREKIEQYLEAVRDASQFHSYERLFSLWHIFHIPIVYMLVFSGFYHVYAVHAY
ncbi:MAG: hypothetical protein R8M11_01675 [Gallionella sp.]